MKKSENSLDTPSSLPSRYPLEPSRMPYKALAGLP